MTFKAIGFDIDGTLYPSLRLNLALARFGFRNYRHLRAFSAVRRELRQISDNLDYRASPPAGLEEFHRFQASLVARRLGADDEAVYDRIETLFYRQIPESFLHVRPFQGAAASLKAFKEAGFLLGALSDFPGDRKLELLGLRDFFHVSMTSEETGFLKPNPRPLEVLAERLNVSPSELLYVGNSVPYDVAGALAAGVGAALIRPFGRGDSGGADFTFRKYEELTRWVLDGR